MDNLSMTLCLILPRFIIRISLPVSLQLLLEKRHLDCFTNPNLEGLLLAFDAARYIVYGVVTEICVKYAAFGLLDRGKKVEIVTDGVCALNEQNAKQMFDEFLSRGGLLTQSSAVLQ